MTESFRSTGGARALAERLLGPIVLCAVAVAGLGFLTMLGWLADIPDLRSFGPGKIAMAPSTALFFLLYGALVLEQGHCTELLARRLVVAGLLGISLLIAAGLLVSSSLDIYSPLEYLGLPVAGVFNGVPLGHMSPLTAFGFLLAGSALLGLVLDGPGRRIWPPLLTFACASLLSLVSFALLLAYLLGSPIFYGSGLIPPALPTSLALFLLATALQGLGLNRLLISAQWPRFQTASSYYGLLLIFIILIGGIMVVGFVSFRHEEQQHRTAMARQLGAVAELKSERITAWLRERDTHGVELMHNQGFADRVEQWLGQGHLAQREVVLARLADHLVTYDYDGIMLFDGERNLLQGLGHYPLPDPMIDATIDLAAQRGGVQRSDLYRCPAGQIRMIWVVPIVSLLDARPLAFVVRHVDAANFLLPFLAARVGSGHSSASGLVRRDGEQAVLLDGSRDGTDAAFALRIPLSRPEDPAVQAVLGREGIIEGRDHRGIPVMAALKPVSGSDWWLVVRINLAEVYAPLSGILWVMMLIVMFLLLGAAGGVFLLWRRQVSVHGFTLLALAAVRDQQIRNELERRVAQRTSELVALNRELEAFSYSVSHDLKAPLRGVQGYSQLLLRDYRDQLDEEGRFFLTSIGQGVHEMEQLIAGLLAYSRMERRPLRHSAVKLSALVETVLAGFQQDLAVGGTELQVTAPEQEVELDPEALALILRNLVDNAIKFSHASRPPRLTIVAEIADNFLHLRVGDNGSGFEMKLCDRIFELFARLHTDREVAGSGVGLAMVRKAVQRLDGVIRVESEPGRGTTFYVAIPLPVAENAKEGEDEELPGS